MKRIVPVALALVLASYAAPARADGPVVDLRGTFPVSPVPAGPTLERHQGEVVIVDGTTTVTIQKSRLVPLSDLLAGNGVQRLAGAYLVSAISFGDSEANAPDYYVVSSQGQVMRQLIDGGAEKGFENDVDPVISRDGRFVAYVDGPISTRTGLRLRNHLVVYSVTADRLTHVRSFSAGDLYAAGVRRDRVLWHDKSRIYTWRFRTGRISSVAARIGRDGVSANLAAAIVTLRRRGCEAVLDLATDRLVDRTCTADLWALSPDGRLVAASPKAPRGSYAGPATVWLRDRSGAAVVTYDAGAGYAVYFGGFIGSATVILRADTHDSAGFDSPRTLRCTLASCEVVPTL